MSGVALRFGFEDDLIRLHLARLAVLDRNNFDGVRREIGEYLLGEVQDNLDGQKLFDGSAMPQSKAAIARSGKTLLHKGHLRSSYTYQLRLAGVEVGSNRAYAAVHHFGGRTGRKGTTMLPARPVLGVGARQERRMGDFLLDELRKATA